MAQTHRDAKSAMPISAHPLFPAIVALWFAALFGIGSMILPAALFDNASGALQLGAVIPAAAEPVSPSARLVVALVASLLGAWAGLRLARKVVEAQAVAPERRRAAVPVAKPAARDAARRPLSVLEVSALEEISEDGDAAAPAAADGAARRRSLALHEPEGPSEWFQPAGPFADLAEAQVYTHTLRPEFTLSALDEVPEPDEVRESDNLAEEALDLTGMMHFDDYAASAADDESVADQHFDPPTIAIAPAASRRHGLAPLEPLEMAAAFAPQAPVQPCFPAPLIAEEAPMPMEYSTDPIQEPAPAPIMEPATESTQTQGDFAELDLDGLAQRLARAIRAREEREKAAAAVAIAPVEATPAPLSPFIADAPIAPDGGLQSFFTAEPTAPTVSVFNVAPHETTDEASEDAKASADTLLPRALPAALRPVDLDAMDDEDIDAPNPFGKTFNPWLHPADSFDAAGDPEAQEQMDDHEADEHGSDGDGDAEIAFSSLLAMKNPFRASPEQVRVELPEHEEGTLEPAVVFPGQLARIGAPADPEANPFARPAAFQSHLADADDEETAPAPAKRLFDRPATDGTAPAAVDPEETERALRAALASLQRFSGAA